MDILTGKLDKDREEEIITSGTWYYDKKIPKKILIYRVPAKYACIRYDNDDVLMEESPIPETSDGFVYKTQHGGEEFTLEEIKAWADSQVWGPCVWDD